MVCPDYVIADFCYEAVHYKDHGLLEFLLKRTDEKQNLFEILCPAASLGNLQAVKLLLKKNADILSSHDADGLTALHHAVSGGHIDVVKEILAFDKHIYIHVDEKGMTGMTPLHLASHRGHVDVVKLLARKGANVDAHDDCGRTPLLGCNLDVAEALLNAGADVNCVDKNGRGPLHYSYYPEDREIMNLLIRHGASINLPDSSGKTPLECAVERRDDNSNIIELLISKGADPNIQNKKGKTALFYAVKSRDAEVVQILLDAHACPNVQDRNGNTPLWEANARHDVDIMKLLLKYRANVWIQNKQDSLAIFHAAMNGSRSTMLDVLLQSIDSPGQSIIQEALDIAKASGNREGSAVIRNYIRAKGLGGEKRQSRKV